MEPITLAFCGVHSTGKSTLIDMLRNRYRDDIHVIGGLMRDLIAAGYGVGPETSRSTLEAYVMGQEKLERASRESGAGLVVSDRLLVDGLAYVRANDDAGQRRLSDDEMRFFEAVAAWQAVAYRAVVYVPIEFPLVPDGVRPEDESYRVRVDEHLIRLLEQLGRPVIEVRGTVDARLSAIEAWVRDQWNAR